MIQRRSIYFSVLLRSKREVHSPSLHLHIDMISREVRNMMRLRVNYGTSLDHAIYPFSSTKVT